MDTNQMIIAWKQMKSGDHAALALLFDHFYSDLYHYGLKIVNEPDLVKDSVQDVFLRIWERRTTLGDVKNTKAYLLSSVRRRLLENKAINWAITSRNPEDSDSQAFSFSSAEFIEVEETSRQLRSLLVQSINSLPDRQRELIFLRFYFNLSYAEIARIMDVKEQTIKNMMQRAIANLRTKIDSQLWEGIDYRDELLMALLLLFQKKIDLG
ncbi:RNA polymerase sigma factor [uncultured Sunxiuqinia sp.]|uniref:RNA polymerase sigma factor n=1 Tax=uncultured Sunxiuqinia sp. TaxID=1573825 RepID=UPI00263683EE|nr:RNA polymerase sigma factor [uncultured Sunxiuqinia sp.]